MAAFNLASSDPEQKISFYDRSVQLCPEERGSQEDVKQEPNVDLMRSSFCQVIDRFGSSFPG